MTEPTDAAIDTLILEHGVMGQAWPTQRQLHAFARAVHAKWGNPAPMGGEPVAWTLTAELEKRETTTRAHLWFSDPVNCMWTPLYTAGQVLAMGREPQAGAVPLTKEQAASLCKMGPVYAPDGRVVRTPEQYRRELEGAKLAGIRTAERAHGIGIKGGQHGT